MRYTKLLTWAAVLLVGYLVITQPGTAAGLTHQVVNLFQRFGDGFSIFVTNL